MNPKEVEEVGNVPRLPAHEMTIIRMHLGAHPEPVVNATNTGADTHDSLVLTTA
jgi:hypothetical protein